MAWETGVIWARFHVGACHNLACIVTWRLYYLMLLAVLPAVLLTVLLTVPPVPQSIASIQDFVLTGEDGEEEEEDGNPQVRWRLDR